MSAQSLGESFLVLPYEPELSGLVLVEMYCCIQNSVLAYSQIECISLASSDCRYACCPMTFHWGQAVREGYTRAVNPRSDQHKPSIAFFPHKRIAKVAGLSGFGGNLPEHRIAVRFIPHHQIVAAGCRRLNLHVVMFTTYGCVQDSRHAIVIDRTA